MYEFTYQRPATLAEAQDALVADEEAKLLAGGMTLLPTMKQRLARPNTLIDIARLKELGGIARDGAHVVIGAGVKHVDVATSQIVRDAIPALADLAGHIGDPHVRHMGTLGGSVCNNDPSADYPSACLGLGAKLTTTGRIIDADDFFLGMFETALDPGEILVNISFPIPKRAAYVKFPNPASGYAMVGVFVAETADGVRVAVTGAGPCVFRVPEMESALGRRFAPDAIKGITIDPDPLTSDLHGSAEYRASLVSTMAERAVKHAAGG